MTVTLAPKPAASVSEPTTVLEVVSKSWITSPTASALPLKLVPLRLTLKPGRSTLVRLSVLLVPLSWAAARSGAPGAPATRVSMFSARAVVAPLAALSTVLPQLSLRRAFRV